MIDSKKIILTQVNRIIFKQICSHHPSCDRYSHHIFDIFGYQLCVGCTGIYSAFSVLFIFDIVFKFNISYIWRFFIGILFFIPAIIQLFYKSHHKFIKFIMRYSLGLSAYLLFTTSLLIPIFIYKILLLFFYLLGILIYHQSQGRLQLLECNSCSEEFFSCELRYGGILDINNIDTIVEELPDDIRFIVKLNLLDKK